MSGGKLSTAFRNLLELSRQHAAIETPKIENARLPKIADSIRVDRVQARPVEDVSLLLKWREALKANGVDHLTSRELRRLSWEPEVALSDAYLTELRMRDLPLGRGFLKGLVFSVLTSWGENNSRRLLGYLREYEKVANASPYLKKIAPYILAEDGHITTANALIAAKSTVQRTLSEIFGIALSTTKYAHEVLAVVIEVGHQKVLSSSKEERSWFYAEILQHVNKEVLLLCLEKVVSAIDGSKNDAAKEEFKRFVLHHPNLGDPRLPGYEGNWPKDKQITAKVIEWLSQSDIKFFFELFIEKQSDRQGRKQFWLKYAHLVKGTRVIVSQHDNRRLARQISEMREEIGTSNLFADLQESNEKSTAFLMDFGKVIVVEFSSYGHSCYFYSSDSKFPFLQRSLFWGTNSFSKLVLKSTKGATEYHSHHDGWEYKFENVLARYGLRQKVERRGY